MNTRTGSMLLIALALTGVMVVLAFTFVSVATLWRDTARSVLRTGLAAEATATGLAHAQWVIGRDWLDRPTEPAHLRSAWRSEFDPLGLAYDGMANAGSPGDLTPDNVRIGDFLTNPYAPFSNTSGIQDGPERPYRELGLVSHHGLARYHELNRHGLALGSAAPAFSDRANAAALERSIAYDNNWLPAAPGRERYRVRYAVAVEDLGGHLLLPRQAPWAAAGTLAQRSEYDPALVAAGYHRSFYNIADLAGAAGAQGRLPTDIVTMFNNGARNRGGFLHWQAVFQGLGSGLDQMHFAGFDSQGDVAMVDYDDGTQAGLTAGTSDPALAASLNRQADLDRRVDQAQVRMLSRTGGGRGTLTSTNQGAVYSWSHLRSLLQTRNNVPNASGPAAPATAYPAQPSEMTASAEASAAEFVFTPFGDPRRMVGTLPARATVDCPWMVNPLTAPPRVIAAMVGGVLRRELKMIRYDSESHTLKTGNAPNGDPIYAAAPYFGGTIPLDQQETQTFDAVDLFTARFQAPGGPFAAFNPRYNYNANAASLQLRLDPALPADYPYPGAEFHVTAVEEAGLPGGMVAKKVQDVLGAEVTASEMDSPMASSGRSGPRSPDAGSRASLLPGFIGRRTVSHWQRKLNDPADADGNLYVWTSSQANPKSYWWDAASALAHACAVARAGWSASGALDPAGVGMAKAVASTRDLDAVFLGLLGEDPSVLGADPNPQRYWIGDTATGLAWRKLSELGTPRAIAWLKTNNRLDASDATRNAMRARQMEMLVNDLRMSFFGADPAYTTFQALDLDGDGRFSSSYTGDGSAAQPQRWFSLTGYFAFGKAHWFRIWVRGEVWDALTRQVVDADDLEAVYVIDPGGLGPAHPDSLAGAHLVFQRRLENRNAFSRSRAAP